MRVFFADDEVTVRSALRLLLEHETRTTVVAGEAADAQSLFAQMQEVQPELLLLDWELPGAKPNGHAALFHSPGEMIASLHALCPELKIIALSGCPDAQGEALAAGVNEFICKVDSPERLIEALHVAEKEHEIQAEKEPPAQAEMESALPAEKEPVVQSEKEPELQIEKELERPAEESELPAEVDKLR